MRYSHKHILSSTQISDNTRLPDYFFELLVQDKVLQPNGLLQEAVDLVQAECPGQFLHLKTLVTSGVDKCWSALEFLKEYHQFI
jgi:hypothetical protein